MSATIMQAPAATADRYTELVTDETPWNMNDIAAALDVKPQTVRSWRKQARRAAREKPAAPHPNELPPSESPTGATVWRAGTIRKWAIQTGRMSPEGVPQRLKPPGRPRTVKAA